MIIKDRNDAEYDISTIPDLWHAVMYLREQSENARADAVLKVWHLAHAMQDHITRTGSASPRDMLPSIHAVPFGKTKGELAEEILDCNYDIALPQLWLNDIKAKSDLPYAQLLSSLVWSYPDHCGLCGLPAPLTRETAAELTRLDESFYVPEKYCDK